MAEIDLTPEERAKIEELYDLAMTGTYYEVLGVGADADGKAVQRVYYELSRTWHPDRFFRRELGPYRERVEVLFGALTRAYKTLSDDADRARYNRDLAERGVKIGPARRDPAPGALRSGGATVPPVGIPPREVSVHEISFQRSTPPTSSPAPAGASMAPSSAPSAPPPAPQPTPRPLRRPESKVVSAMRDQVRDRLERARRYYVTGQEDFAAGHYLKAAGAFQLASEFDPKNEQYRQLYEESQVRAKGAQLEQLLTAAKKADEGFQEAAAMHYLKQAVQFDLPDAAIYYRVARWVRDRDKDQRGALALFRKAVDRKPENADYRMALGDMYAAMKMELNARREYGAVLERDKKHEGARKAIAALKG